MAIISPVGPNIDFRIGMGNTYVGNKTPAKAVSIINSLNCNSFGGNECTKIAARLAALKRYHDVTQYGFANPSDANDCVTIVRRDQKIEHFQKTLVCKAVEPKRLAKNRVFDMVAYRNKQGDAIVHLNFHPNPINFLKVNANPPIAQQHTKSIYAAEDMINLARNLGYRHFVITGDGNVTRSKAALRETAHPTQKTPLFLSKKLNLNLWTTGLEWFMYSKNLKLVKKHRINQDVTNSDHPWLVGDLKVL